MRKITQKDRERFQPKQKKWEKEFDELHKVMKQFAMDDCPICGFNPTRGKNWIASLLADQRKELLDEVEGMIIDADDGQDYGKKLEALKEEGK